MFQISGIKLLINTSFVALSTWIVPYLYYSVGLVPASFAAVISLVVLHYLEEER
ncbi:MAG: hypothetical protein H0Z39_02895 [Peptococcaceae bacterium]|nr:hypothetical protein [Peptococcaceae bacterium]